MTEEEDDRIKVKTLFSSPLLPFDVLKLHPNPSRKAGNISPYKILPQNGKHFEERKSRMTGKGGVNKITSLS